MTNGASNSLPLQTLSNNGKPPSKRVRDAADAREIASALVNAGRERARFNTQIKGMLDGNAPFNAAKLRQNAQAYRANVSFRGGKAMLSSALVPYYDLFAGAKNYCEVKLYLDNPDDQEYKSGIVTEEFDCLLKKYKAFIFNMNGMIHDMVAIGKGFLMFPNRWGWHFQRVNFNRVFVPDGTEASVEKLELPVIREKMQLHTLWNQIKDKDKAKEAGWFPAECAEAIRNAMAEDDEFKLSDGTSYPYVQQKMKDRDILNGTKQPTVQVAHLLVKEFDGTITHQIVEEAGASVTQSAAGAKEPKLGEKFLFEKTNKYKNMREVLSAFFWETLDGSWNGATGLGHEIYAQEALKDRLMCKTVDNAFLTSAVTLQAKTAGGQQKAAITQIGNINVLPPDFDVLNAQIFANSQPLITCNQLLDETISTNTGIFKTKMEKAPGNPETAKAVELRFQNATVLSNSAVGRFYGQLDPFYEELYRRVTEEDPMDGDKSEEAEAVREFRRRCKKRGVELKELRKVESVRAVRNIGNGSQFQRQQSLSRLEPYIPYFPEAGKLRWAELIVASELGYGMANYLVPPKDKQLMPNDQQAMAMIENAALKSGAPVAWTPTQNNVIHLTEHLKAMSAAAESLSNGADPMVVLSFLESAGPHAHIHLDKLSSDPSRKTEFALLSKEFKKVTQFADMLQKQVSDQQEEAQQQQEEMMAAQQQAAAIESGQTPESIIAAAKAKNDMAIKNAKAAQALNIKEQAARQKLVVNDLKTAQTLRHNSLKVKTASSAK